MFYKAVKWAEKETKAHRGENTRPRINGAFKNSSVP